MTNAPEETRGYFAESEPVERAPARQEKSATPFDRVLTDPDACDGIVLGGRYRLESHQGTGGMAVVFRALDMNTGHTVAVKLLRPDLVQQDSNYISRFQREAEAASRMTHHNIVNLLDVGQEGSIRYLVMEYVEGHTLKEIIEERGRLTPETSVQFAIRILSALQHAHRQHIIHRDIKPQNILVDRQGYVKVADFGIARIASRETLTKKDTVVGSVHYFSPEQARGEPADERSDIYSVGVCLYEMLTGTLPFDAEDGNAVAYQQVNADPPPFSERAPDVSPLLEAVVRKAMAKNPDERYQRAAQMAGDLQAAIDGRVDDMLARPGELLSRARPGQEQAAPALWRRLLALWSRTDKGRLARILATTALTIAVFYGLYAGGMRIYENVVNSATVPDFIYMDVNVAQRTAQQQGLNVRIMETYDAGSTAGTVIQQAPQESTTLKKGDTVVLTVSRGPATLLVPNVVNKTMQDAIVAAQKVNMTVTVVERVVSTSVQSDFVLSQSPEAGTQVSMDNNVLQVVVSGGAALVPKVVGEPFETAQQTLTASGLSVSRNVRYENVSEALLHNTVAAQSLEPGAYVIRNTSISLTVYQVPSLTRVAEMTLELPESQGMMTVVVTLEHNGIEVTSWSQEYAADATRTPTIPLSIPASGTYTIHVYCDGRLQYSQELKVE